jgi:hypothetical protein
MRGMRVGHCALGHDKCWSSLSVSTGGRTWPADGVGAKVTCPHCLIGVQVCVPMADYRWACVRGTHFKQEAFHSLSLARSANQSSSLHQYRHPPSPVKFNAERAVACHAEYAPDIQLGIFFIRTVIRVLTIRTWGNPTYSP